MRQRPTRVPPRLFSLIPLLLVSTAPVSSALAHFAPAPDPGSAPAGQAPPGSAEAWFDEFASGQALDTLVQVVGAIVLFIVGWIVAKLLSYAVLQVLSRTSVDNIIADKFGLSSLLRERSSSDQAVERFVAGIVYWTSMLLVVVGVLDYAGLEQVATPIEGLVAEVTGALPDIAKAGLILLVAYIAGRVLRMGVSRVLERVGVDKRFAELTDGDPSDHTPFSEAAGRVLFWLIMVVGLAGAFEALDIGPIAEPMHNAIDQIVGILPRLAKAIVLVMLGYFGGKIVRSVLRNLLSGLGFDALVKRAQLDRFLGQSTGSDIVAIAAMVFIIVQAVIAALNELGLDTLSVPLTQMMGQFWNLLPALAISVLIVVAGTFVGQLLRGVTAGALRNVGFDKLMERLGFRKFSGGGDSRLSEYSQLVGYAVQVAVVLLATAQALDNLTLDTWAAYVNAFLAYVVKHVAVALVIVGVGMAIGNYVRDLVKARSDDEAQGSVAEFARYVVLVFAVTMAVQQLDVAEDFVLMTFGLLFGALCLGAALAFGLGGREVAGDILKKRYDQVRNRGAARGGPPSARTTRTIPAVPSSPDEDD